MGSSVQFLYLFNRLESKDSTAHNNLLDSIPSMRKLFPIEEWQQTLHELLIIFLNKLVDQAGDQNKLLSFISVITNQLAGCPLPTMQSFNDQNEMSKLLQESVVENILQSRSEKNSQKVLDLLVSASKQDTKLFPTLPSTLLSQNKLDLAANTWMHLI